MGFFSRRRSRRQVRLAVEVDRQLNMACWADGKRLPRGHAIIVALLGEAVGVVEHVAKKFQPEPSRYM